MDITKGSIKEDEKIINQAISVFLDLVKKYMFIPYHIENWVILFDIHEKGVMSLPLGTLKSLIVNMSTNCSGRLYKFFIVNPPWILRASWSVITGFMDPETATKM